jgi:hypothetical protein
MERREALNDPKVILRNVSIFDDDEVFDVLRFVTKGIRWKYTIALRVIVKDRVGIMKSNGLIYDGLISGQFHSYFWYDGEFSPMVSVGLTIHDWSFPRYYCTLRTKMRRGYINDSNYLLLLDRTEALVAVLALKFVMYGGLRLKSGKEEGAEWYGVLEVCLVKEMPMPLQFVK